MFTLLIKSVMKHLERKDKRKHAQAKSIIKDCVERKKRQEPGYESVTTSTKRRLRELVGDEYWRKAEENFFKFMKHQQMRRRQAQKQQNTQQQRQQIAQKRQGQQHNSKQEQTMNIPKQRPTSAVAAPSQVQREQLETRVPATPSTDKATTKSKSKSKSKAASKASGSDSKTTSKAKTTKKTVRRKSASEASMTSRKNTFSKTAPAGSIVVEEPPREYNELMEMIDHAVEYDWPSIGHFLGNKADLKLSDEERQLLYGDRPPQSSTKKKTAKTPAKAANRSTQVDGESGSSSSNQDQSTSPTVSDAHDQDDKNHSYENGVRPGWGSSNVLSARAAWSRVRLEELGQQKADGLRTLPTAASPQQQHESSPIATVASTTTITQAIDTDASVTPPKPVAVEGSWVDEETAEQDKALALLSEACQIYLKGILQKAIQCARQRQNLDGIRLWHQQYAFNKGIAVGSTIMLSKDAKNKSADKPKKPPLALRLGCDVSRQAAQAQGNAALTVKRMEEALNRQTGISMHIRELNTETLLEATSMGDLSWRPHLKQGVEKADYQAKRSFEAYGGKEAKDPPLGRAPKKAKLFVEDFVMGSALTIDGAYHKAYTGSSFVSF